MAISNTAVIYIDGINRTSKVVNPIKYSNLLDERLDECTLSLRNINKESFAPLTPVEIELRNVFYYGEKPRPWNNTPRKDDVQTQTDYFFVAADAAEESILGAGVYNHDLTLIEITKIAELVVVDTITFTNDIGRNYTENATLAQPIFG